MRLRRIIITIAGLWLIAVPIMFCLMRCFAPNPATMELTGQFGDSFGAVNALFSGTAIILVAYTVFLQREDLKVQQTMLAEQIGEMKEHSEMQRQQLLATVTTIGVAGETLAAEALKLASQKSMKDGVGSDVLANAHEIRDAADRILTNYNNLLSMFNLPNPGEHKHLDNPPDPE